MDFIKGLLLYRANGAKVAFLMIFMAVGRWFNARPTERFIFRAELFG